MLSSEVLRIILLCLATVGAGFLLLGFLAKLAPRWGLVDVPSQRKRHENAVPLVGGIAIWTIIVVGTLALRGMDAKAWQFVAMLTGLFLIGLIDDCLKPGMSAKSKGVATLVILLGFQCTVDPTSWWLVPPAFVVIHSMNTSDNSNGLASGLALVGLIPLSVIGGRASSGGVDASLVVLLGGSLLAFWTLNFPRGRVFLGDSGSLLLGGCFAGWFLRTQDPAILCLVALPLADLLSVAWIRLRSGHKPWVGDWNHVSHRLAARVGAKPATLLLLLAQSAWSGLGCWLFVRPENNSWALESWGWGSWRWHVAGSGLVIAFALCLGIRTPPATLHARTRSRSISPLRHS